MNNLPQLMRRRMVQDLTGLSRTTIYRLMAAGKFPRPVRIGERAVAWRADDLAAFIDSRTAA
ncbi:Prophage CP4-57 regulatory protein (AlpA) [compost metagenome]